VFLVVQAAGDQRLVGVAPKKVTNIFMPMRGIAMAP